MPATAGRVRMPANNRVHSSAALQTHGIWQSAIGYDPYAPNQNNSKQSSDQNVQSSEPEGENAYASFQGLLALARLTGSNADEARGSCKKCGRVGHLTFQCRNFLSVKEEVGAIPAVIPGSDKQKANGKGSFGEENDLSDDSSEDEEEEESKDESDSEEDSEIERIIASRMGKGTKKVSGSSNKKRVSRERKHKGSEEDDSDSSERRHRKREERERREKRKRRGHRRPSDSEDSDRKSKRENRKSRQERKKRSHRYLDSDSEAESVKRRRKSSRRSSDSETDRSSGDSERGRSRHRSHKRKH
ncbi:hypothetical protein AMTRI_Chr13g92400 [Amborella trichopoda]|uniref:CCHC-type domain-containing protein n=1 Tax=Amborella trichopoda TaxID=13333 RepID=U5D559_AMBTC|nr:CAX-interacting protein 4 [Amborella trichopoda]XP_020530182.1 CAX-interacting protein 4 [Amborella trichopoda]XP_020530183.1 CAX-interacting protein 4 [Amborella trichopoda]XP_020530184.1 CAX-interacting protein 4 [Amborella trichopoda]ERN17559.1 hypothetical protein AMTR_s00059p00128930 [Amborella trichopoda]|eukprot:XP_020530181.1 CAX-interacting protein 4 [Amborella trichopoda]